MSFQTLPELVVRSIIGYIIPRQTLSSSRTELEEARSWRLAVEVFNTCHGWRKVGEPYLCKRYHIYTRLHNTSSAALEPWSSVIGMPPSFDFVDMVSVMSITVKLSAIFDGTATGFINSQQHVFGSAHTLRITIFGAYAEFPGHDGIGTSTNLNEFIRCIQQLVPNLSWITILSNYQHWRACQNNKHQTYPKAIDPLIRLAKKPVRIGLLQAGVQLVFNNNLEAIRDLSHIEFSDATGDKHLALVRFYAKSLTSLTLQYMTHEETGGLIYDRKTNQHVVYECLRFFKVSVVSGGSRPNLSLYDKGVVPFPKLETFLCPELYPFHDDTLFRGNSGTLKKMAMNLHPHVVNVLIRHQVFTRSHYRALRYVRFLDTSPLRIFSFKMVAEISRYAESLSYYNDPKDENINAAIVVLQLDNLASVRKLDLETTYFNLGQFHRLVLKLPQLFHLRCGIQDEKPGRHTNVAKYGQANWKFRKLQLSFVEHTSAERLLKIFNVLRRLCPNFKTVQTEFNLDEQIDGLAGGMEGLVVNEIPNRNDVY